MTTTAVRGDIATQAQLDFLSDLLAGKELSDSDRALHTAALPAITKKGASILIGQLIRLPKRTIVPELAFGEPIVNELNLALASVPKSKYAVPTSEIDPMFFDGALHNDLIFVEVREYMHKIYMRQLTGSLGDFSRRKLSQRDQLTILNIISADTYKYVRLFGENFSCCGCCGATLTDDVSRELLLGPTCRTYFGYDNHGNRVVRI
jgi:Family of unknown function (DUF6011)